MAGKATKAAAPAARWDGRDNVVDSHCNEQSSVSDGRYYGQVERRTGGPNYAIFPHADRVNRECRPCSLSPLHYLAVNDLAAFLHTYMHN